LLVGVIVEILLVIFLAGLPLGLAKVFMLGLLLLVDGNLDVGEGGFGAPGSARDLAVDDALVDAIQEFAVLLHVDGGGPLMRNAEYELREKVLVHLSLAVAVVVPLLGYDVFHLSLAVERREDAVDPGQQLLVLLLSDGVGVLVAGLTDEGPVLRAHGLELGLREQQALFGFANDGLYNVI
jgi:hypothetical protein